MRISMMAVMAGVMFAYPAFAGQAIVAAFGDSLVAGYGVAPAEAFPARIEAKLNASGVSAKVLNDGVSGDTTAGGVSRVDGVIAQHPDVAIVVLGGNDLLRGTPPEETRRNLDIILSRLHAVHIRLLVTGQKAPLSFGSKYASAFNALFCDLAKKYDGLCYPFLLGEVYGHSEWMQEDGIHPNPLGAEKIATALTPMVRQLIEAKP